MSRQRLMLLLLVPIWLFASGFTPFTDVPNVCPQCPGPKTDVVTLTSGRQIPCTVVAQNQDYYVITRHGEYRAVMKNEVTSITWKSEMGPSSLGTGDQILVKGAVVLHGTIMEQKPGRYFVIQVGSRRHVVFNTQIESLHKAGQPVTLTQEGATQE